MTAGFSATSAVSGETALQLAGGVVAWGNAACFSTPMNTPGTAALSCHLVVSSLTSRAAGESLTASDFCVHSRGTSTDSRPLLSCTVTGRLMTSS